MKLDIDEKLLYDFETHLNPMDMEDSPVSAKLVGYGEISSIFKLGDNDSVVFKRLPIFKSREEAEHYSCRFLTYSEHLARAGLNIPGQETVIITVPDRPVSLYIAQKAYPSDSICSRKIQSISTEEAVKLISGILDEVKKIRDYNNKNRGQIELSLDSQISNWAYTKNGGSVIFYYIDTSTPLYRIDGVEQFEPEPLLKSSPPGLRWILRKFFLDDVMNRYYDYTSVLTDLAANLYKEQKPELVGPAVKVITDKNKTLKEAITVKSVESYYREDKLIWSLFLSFRKADRFLKTKIFGKRYEFILPGKIKR